LVAPWLALPNLIVLVAHTQVQTQSEGLNKEQFIASVGKIVGLDKSDKDLRSWFNKIDYNSDGSVDKEEFVNWLLMENMGFLEVDEQPVCA
jgi:Ca2+-binding EF-hand superfamily protein